MASILLVARSRYPNLTRRLALAVIVCIAVLCSASSWSVYGHKWDEPEHLAAGL